MRIAVVHSFYGSGALSGENVAVVSQAEALRRAGHDVRLFGAHTDELQHAVLYSVRAGLRVAFGRGHSPLAELRSFAPDVVHVHNLFPNFSASWLRRVEATVLATLHNYRTVCANAVMYREGQPCTLCIEGDRWAGVRFGCYRGSRVATAPLAWANRRGLAHNVLLDRADRVIVLSDVQRAVYLRAGLPEDKTEVVPNFLPDELDPGPEAGVRSARRGWLAVGRLSPEKGLVELLEGWPEGVPLTVIGDGPLKEQVRLACQGSERMFLGSATRADVVGQMTRHVGLVVASRWFEACPLVYIEALAAGLPVLAWDPSGVAQFVRREGTGVAMPRGTNPSSVVTASSPWNELAGAPVRRAFEANYTEGAFVDHFERLVR